ncbi:MAG TPA: bifunctional helix-turn-helix transcriptional regulator/GNAT family N-acetyltransferase [Gemmatimonadales bacterium]|nr:bifunctional helix-turn-helix transcriptional regulator/GNAT family N-acetyltransferase [Gemmatimonadales bacterium]
MSTVAQVRSFNRTVTHRIGVLEGHFLGRARSLAASRLLFEIGPDGIEVRHLRARLDLDSGYTSRLLRGLEAEGLIRTGRSSSDARARWVTLTPAGRKELAALNRLSDKAAASLLDRLNETQRGALVAAMETVERLLLAGAVGLDVEDPRSLAARYCLGRYFEELATRFETGFDPARSISAAARELTPPHGFFVLATLNDEPVGCGALKCHAAHGEIKRMWVAPSFRGLGIGKRILDRLEALARERRLPLLRLETNKALTEAQSLYKRCGYREVSPFNDEPYAHHWFEKALRPARQGRHPSERTHPCPSA